MTSQRSDRPATAARAAAVPRARAATCPECAWTGDGHRARFCPRCGAVLTDRPAAARPGARSGVSGGRLLVAVGLAGVLLLGAATQGTDVLRPLTEGLLGDDTSEAQAPGATDPRDDEVEVPAPGEIPPSSAPADAGAEQAPPASPGQSPDDASLSCEPAGCQRWHRSLEGGWSLAAAANDHLAVVRRRADAPDEVEVAVLDPVTGEERFRRAYTPPPAPAPERETRAAAEGTQLVLVGQSMTSLVAERRLTSLSLDAAPRWTRQLPLDRFGGADAVADRATLLTGARMRSTLAERLLVVDARTGELLWAGEGQPYAVLGDQLLVASTAARDALRVEARGLRDGALAWQRDGVWPRWTPEGLGVVPLARRTDDGGDLMVDLATGRDVLAVGGVIQSVTPARDGGAFVLVDHDERTVEGDAYVRPGEWLSGRDDDLELIALGATGDVRWRADVPVRVRGYAWMQATDLGTLVLAADGRAVVGFATATGAARIYEGTARLGTPASEWRDGQGRMVTTVDDRLGVRSGIARVDVLGDDLWLVSDNPLVVTDEDALIGVALVTRP